ncbi:MAG: DUF927 domain-containing protein [Nevskia sp.]|nr:DUF927 domain-containing protein [Nevskia sp.]
MRDPIAQFRDAILAAGLNPPDVIEPDGKLHRFASNGKRGDDAGWYVFHNDRIPAGAYGDWRSGTADTWRADIGRTLTAAEETDQHARVEAIRRERETREARRRAAAARKAAEIWNAAMPATADHPYLVAKGVKPHGLRTRGGRLIAPARVGDELLSLQFIAPDGGKRFLPGGSMAGCHFIIGAVEGTAALCIAEGFATGATVHEATGRPVAVAFNSGNLLSVAKAMRERFPSLPLVLCADDDTTTEGNPGLTKASEAARAVGGLVALPDFGRERQDGATDFNDQAAARGPESVRSIIERTLEAAMIHSDVAGVTDVQSSNDEASAITSEAPGDVAGVAPGIPTLEDRPRFCVFEDWHADKGAQYRPGVWYFGLKPGTEKTSPTPIQQWVSGPLYVDAVTFDAQDNNYGRLLRFRNTSGRWRDWAMPMELLSGKGDELRAELLAMGLEIDLLSHRLLGQYLLQKAPQRRMRCATQVGWCGDSYVLPDEVIGPSASDVTFQSSERGHAEHTTGGTLAGWQAEIAARSVGNPLLVLALSASFAGPLLDRCKAESGGIHLVGDSSTGKTTAIDAACSTWGGPSFRRSWRATANGMEGAAALFNDGLLALDEISECDPREVGAIVYTLGNGQGKQRATRSGGARSVTRWRCIVLSSGERTIATTMAEGGHRAKAGQSVRLLDVPATRRFGAWDELHGMVSGTAFSDAIRLAAATHYGYAGRAFLHRLARDGGDCSALLESIKARPEFCPGDAEGQDKRAAARFALLALAGELTTEYGISGWPRGEAIAAAAEGFRAWHAQRGRGNDERRQILEQVSAFIERHGDARFSCADALADTIVRDRAGWWRDEGGAGRVYLFSSDGMREALRGFDFKRALDVLQAAGALPAPDGGERARPLRISGRAMRLYPIRADKLGADHGR